MSVVISVVDGEQIVGYQCDACGKLRVDLSDSWSEISISTLQDPDAHVLHHCLECRSIKKEWREPVQ